MSKNRSRSSDKTIFDYFIKKIALISKASNLNATTLDNDIAHLTEGVDSDQPCNQAEKVTDVYRGELVIDDYIRGNDENEKRY